MKKLTTLKEWHALMMHKEKIASQNMRNWFNEDPHRFERFSVKKEGILLDYSKNRITPDTLSLLIALAKKRKIEAQIEALFTGLPVNTTEKKPALHTALRNPTTNTFLLDNRNIMADIRDTQEKMHVFSEKIRQKQWLGLTGKPITDIVNIGMGGSHLGPLLTIHALSDFAHPDLHCHFISNIDSAHIHEILLKINPETTLFIVSSKSFSTLETITNAASVRAWFKNQMKTEDLSKHWVAVTAEITEAEQFGIHSENIFPLWDWVGGRYSIWSAIGLPLAIMIGMDRFHEFLEGGFAIDEHFRYAPLHENIPVILALLNVWYINFFGALHQAIIPYSHHLNYLRVYLQQLEMESNGKNISDEGHTLDYLTCPIIFGEQGCNGQHAFHQLLHQGQHFVPVDFILVGKSKEGFDDHHHILVGSGLSQAQALMSGKSYDEAFRELQSSGLSEEESHYLAKHKTIPGNRPSNVLFIDQISPRILGALIALYEHKTFVQGIIWGINSFDQWGVELGKKLLPIIVENLKSETNISSINDSSTIGLIKHFKNMRNSI